MLIVRDIPTILAAARSALIEWPAERLKVLLIHETCVVCGAPADGERLANGTALCAACAAEQYVQEPRHAQ